MHVCACVCSIVCVFIVYVCLYLCSIGSCTRGSRTAVELDKTSMKLIFKLQKRRQTYRYTHVHSHSHTHMHTHTLIHALSLRQTTLDLQISAMTMGHCRLRWDRGKEARPRSNCCKIGTMNEASSHTHKHTYPSLTHTHSHLSHTHTSRLNVDIAQNTHTATSRGKPSQFPHLPA